MKPKSSALRTISDYYLEELVLTSEVEPDETSSHYIINCPYCLDVNGEVKKKLWITKEYSCGYCFICRSAYTNPIVKETGVFKPLKFSTISKIKAFSLVKANCYSYTRAKDSLEDGLEYLRNKDERPDPYIQDDYMDWGIKFQPKRIMLPIYFQGELIAYQSRDITQASKGSSNKYYIPFMEHKPIVIVADRHTDKCVCSEGIFGAIACARLFPDRTSIAFLGKTVTAYHAWMLDQMKLRDYLVFMDTTKYSMEFIDLLKQHRLFIEKTSLIVSDGFDPDEALGQNRSLTDVEY